MLVLTVFGTIKSWNISRKSEMPYFILEDKINNEQDKKRLNIFFLLTNSFIWW